MQIEMYKQTALMLNEQIDEIARRWVEELRQTGRTEVHNNMLTVEIVNGMKAVLANLAAAVELRIKPGHETSSMIALAAKDNGISTVLAPERTTGTRPLGDPLTRALQGAAAHGRLRHVQAFELHEVIIEYVKLRQVIWEVLQVAASQRGILLTLEIAQYLDLLLDELMLTSLENFYDSSVRDLEKRAIHDNLTQLYNKDYFQHRLHEELRRALRQRETLTVAMIDMDHLKPINDTYGHAVGDAVITAVASAIRATCRQTDVPCRYGGDEFTVILPETSKTQAVVFAERLLHNVQRLEAVITTADHSVITTGHLHEGQLASGTESETDNQPLRVPIPSISIGLASFPEDGRNPEMLVARADASLYRAKSEGRNRIAY